MGGGNGAKAASKRARNQKDAEKGAAKSQLKVNESAKDIQCDVCKTTFLKTTRLPALTEHAMNKHSKGPELCFPAFVAQQAVAPAKK
ncbi:hypothetical protein EYC80_004162 [Monilinia laxa]|uniref:Uncharacterized protein n=1 Tax=Monilinia laxa TaxID=61186 RepID=A0A5N6KMH3_MONLA|nr:hypothetical protein EYC80_004162 [Monilinia laxa]